MTYEIQESSLPPFHVSLIVETFERVILSHFLKGAMLIFNLMSKQKQSSKKNGDCIPRKDDDYCNISRKAKTRILAENGRIPGFCV
jgi:hypothetical protein